MQYAEDFYKKHNICPSFKAISNANQFNRLLLCTEQEVIELIGNEKQLLDYLENKYKDLNTLCETSEYKKEELGEQNANNERIDDQKANFLINKYQRTVKKTNDLRLLSKIEREEIKRIFHSEFYFLKLLKETK